MYRQQYSLQSKGWSKSGLECFYQDLYSGNSLVSRIDGGFHSNTGRPGFTPLLLDDNLVASFWSLRQSESNLLTYNSVDNGHTYFRYNNNTNISLVVNNATGKCELSQKNFNTNRWDYMTNPQLLQTLENEYLLFQGSIHFQQQQFFLDGPVPNNQNDGCDYYRFANNQDISFVVDHNKREFRLSQKINGSWGSYIYPALLNHSIQQFQLLQNQLNMQQQNNQFNKIQPNQPSNQQTNFQQSQQNYQTPQQNQQRPFNQQSQQGTPQNNFQQSQQNYQTPQQNQQRPFNQQSQQPLQNPRGSLLLSRTEEGMEDNQPYSYFTSEIYPCDIKVNQATNEIFIRELSGNRIWQPIIEFSNKKLAIQFINDLKTVGAFNSQPQQFNNPPQQSQQNYQTPQQSQPQQFNPQLPQGTPQNNFQQQSQQYNQLSQQNEQQFRQQPIVNQQQQLENGSNQQSSQQTNSQQMPKQDIPQFNLQTPSLPQQSNQHQQPEKPPAFNPSWLKDSSIDQELEIERMQKQTKENISSDQPSQQPSLTNTPDLQQHQNPPSQQIYQPPQNNVVKNGEKDEKQPSSVLDELDEIFPRLKTDFPSVLNHAPDNNNPPQSQNSQDPQSNQSLPQVNNSPPSQPQNNPSPSSSKEIADLERIKNFFSIDVSVKDKNYGKSDQINKKLLLNEIVTQIKKATKVDELRELVLKYLLVALQKRKGLENWSLTTTTGKAFLKKLSSFDFDFLKKMLPEMFKDVNDSSDKNYAILAGNLKTLVKNESTPENAKVKDIKDPDLRKIWVGNNDKDTSADEKSVTITKSF